MWVLRRGLHEQLDGDLLVDGVHEHVELVHGSERGRHVLGKRQHERQSRKGPFSAT